MAKISKLSDYATGVILAGDLREGTPVQLNNSGVVNGFNNGLPIAVQAADGATDNVFVLMAAPDSFPRPVDERFYSAPWMSQIDTQDGSFHDPIETRTYYYVGVSNLPNPLLKSGWVAQAHRGCTVTVHNTSFTDSPDIRVPGNKVAVASGKWVYTSGANAVGFVERYDPSDETLTITLHQ